MSVVTTLYRLSLLESLTHRVPKNFHPIAAAFEYDTELQGHVLYAYGWGDASGLKVEKAFAVVNSSRVPLGLTAMYPFVGMVVHPTHGEAWMVMFAGTVPDIAAEYIANGTTLRDGFNEWPRVETSSFVDFIALQGGYKP